MSDYPVPDRPELVYCPACYGDGNIDGITCDLCQGWCVVDRYRAADWDRQCADDQADERAEERRHGLD